MVYNKRVSIASHLFFSFFLARDYNGALFVEDIISNRQSFDSGGGVSFFFLTARLITYRYYIFNLWDLLFVLSSRSGEFYFVPFELELLKYLLFAQTISIFLFPEKRGQSLSHR